ncbi:MAG: tRNA (adenosine(37)-N6)-threonylcarbamoyltransferase complex ATPase subunit type 1 TsaE [Oscillospiraceae bacterium]|nr:tRNA (adenosine(37)-N6)-threonylcarbamoyltransferase complex ATPase subunit type 1 TsaE [Oscillospiraceae bacterium]
MTTRSHSADDTERFGERLARLLRPGDAVWLYGDLGAGKTALVRGLARGLGVSVRVTSPTYALVNLYDAAVPAEPESPGAAPRCLAHYDAYRLEGFDDLVGTGWDEYESGFRAVEWAERAGDSVSGVCVMLEDVSETEREISLCFLP